MQMQCGVDEAGRGPMLGPLVVGAVWCDDVSVLEDIGVKDSKKLTPAQREKMYGEIDEQAPHWEVDIIEPETIDEEMKRLSLNIIELNRFADLAQKHPCDVVIADCPDVDTSRFAAILAERSGIRNVKAEHKADDTYPVVSAASIMAKVTRDRIVEGYEKEFGEPVGSGYPSDPETVGFIEKWIKNHGSAPPHTRTSWKPVKDMLSKRKNTTLDQW
jgi:ribonuclease HII